MLGSGNGVRSRDMWEGGAAANFASLTDEQSLSCNFLGWKSHCLLCSLESGRREAGSHLCALGSRGVSGAKGGVGEGRMKTVRGMSGSVNLTDRASLLCKAHCWGGVGGGGGLLSALQSGVRAEGGGQGPLLPGAPPPLGHHLDHLPLPGAPPPLGQNAALLQIKSQCCNAGLRYVYVALASSWRLRAMNIVASTTLQCNINCNVTR